MKTCLILLLFLFPANLWAQTELENFHTRKQQITTRGMTALTSWAVANLAIGTYEGIKLDKSENKYFSIMNAAWNIVNLPIGLIAIIKAKKDNVPESWEKMAQYQRSTERTYLINGGLDVGYMASGATLMLVSDNSKRPELLKGIGQSILFQGAFLFVFDFVEYGLHKAHRKKHKPNLYEL